MRGIDETVGLQYAGEDEELYREILTDYADGIEEQAQAVERALAAEDIETFTIEVHSLKSTSRTIGAQELSDQAKELEEYGKRCDWEQIRIKTPGLLTAYRELYPVIRSYCAKEEQEAGKEKRSFDREAVEEHIIRLVSSLEAYDSVRAEEIVAKITEYESDEFDSYREELVSALSKFDYEGCKAIAIRWRETIK